MKKGDTGLPLAKLLTIDYNSRAVTVPGSIGKTVKVAFEDGRPAIDDDSFPKVVRDANDCIDGTLQALLASDCLDIDSAKCSTAHEAALEMPLDTNKSITHDLTNGVYEPCFASEDP